MHRRKYLTFLGSGALVSVAGCSDAPWEQSGNSTSPSEEPSDVESNDSQSAQEVDEQFSLDHLPVKTGLELQAIAVGGGQLFGVVSEPRYVAKFDTTTGRVSETYETDGRGNGMTVGARYVWVTDKDTSEILRLTPETGDISVAFESNGDPSGITLGTDSLWVADSSANVIYERSTDGVTRSRFSYESETTGSVGLAYVDGLLVLGDSDGNVYRFATDGTVVDSAEERFAPDARSLTGSQLGLLVVRDGGTVTQVDQLIPRDTSDENGDGEEAADEDEDSTLDFGEPFKSSSGVEASVEAMDLLDWYEQAGGASTFAQPATGNQWCFVRLRTTNRRTETRILPYPDRFHVVVDGEQYEPVELEMEPVNYTLYTDQIRGELKQTGESESGWVPYEIPDGVEKRNVIVDWTVQEREDGTPVRWRRS